MRSISNIALTVSLMAIFMTACKKEEDSDTGNNANGSVIGNVYQDVAPASFLDSLNRCGFPLRTGSNPPLDIIDRFFEVDNIVSCTSLGDILSNYVDDKSIVTNYSPDSQTLDVECRGSGLIQTLQSQKAYLLGEGNDFTVYSRVIIKQGLDSSRFALLFSGTWDADSLVCRNLQNTLMNIEIYSAPSIWMGEGDFRAFFPADVAADSEWGEDYE